MTGLFCSPHNKTDDVRNVDLRQDSCELRQRRQSSAAAGAGAAGGQARAAPPPSCTGSRWAASATESGGGTQPPRPRCPASTTKAAAGSAAEAVSAAAAAAGRRGLEGRHLSLGRAAQSLQLGLDLLGGTIPWGNPFGRADDLSMRVGRECN